jgi:hypothetical protein
MRLHRERRLPGRLLVDPQGPVQQLRAGAAAAGSWAMSTLTRPGKFDAFKKLGPNEPYFALRAWDRHAVGLVRLWALLRELDGERPEIVAEARACADEMERWHIEERGRAPARPAVTTAVAGLARQNAELVEMVRRLEQQLARKETAHAGA